MLKNMCVVHQVAGVLVWVGAINWGLIGLFHFNLVGTLLGEDSSLARVVYVLVGVSALMMLAYGSCAMCKGAKKM
jgi:uncharacterized membrane protein YuzA (DUF378 family)